ncbi:MAG: hypothetical protein AAF752_03260 [Bacteroidota bacterium]
MSKQARLDVDFNALDAQEVEAYLQEGGRGVAEYAASCNTIQAEATTTIINGSCGKSDAPAPAPGVGRATEEVFEDF